VISIIKWNNAGVLQWQKLYGFGNGAAVNLAGTTIVIGTSLIVVAYNVTTSNNAVIIRVDIGSGELQTYSSINFQESAIPWRIVPFDSSSFNIFAWGGPTFQLITLRFNSDLSLQYAFQSKTNVSSVNYVGEAIAAVSDGYVMGMFADPVIFTKVASNLQGCNFASLNTTSSTLVPVVTNSSFAFQRMNCVWEAAPTLNVVPVRYNNTILCESNVTVPITTTTSSSTATTATAASTGSVTSTAGSTAKTTSSTASQCSSILWTVVILLHIAMLLKN